MVGTGTGAGSIRDSLTLLSSVVTLAELSKDSSFDSLSSSELSKTSEDVDDSRSTLGESVDEDLVSDESDEELLLEDEVELLLEDEVLDELSDEEDDEDEDVFVKEVMPFREAKATAGSESVPSEDNDEVAS